MNSVIDDLEQVDLGLFKAESELSGVLIRGGAMQDAVLDRAEIKECCFDKVRLTSCDASKIYLKKSSFIGCDLSNTRLNDGKLTEVVFEDCKLVGVGFNECALDTIVFKNCLMNLSQFSAVTAKKLTFINCQLEQAYFDQAKMPGSKLLDCNLNKADFSQAVIIKSDMRRSTIEGIRVSPSQLGNVIVNPDQALYLARLMGLQIEF